ncbi:unnamed protein product [Miscanthus lutarioriparius]|uniref:CASP-like protein n=1 Tax=Miscanthus lutarioriparius TaxID=422564 RepID=A0A811Q8N5_9POAL|nr:unnamed protein product [Miscanthus lutarioriparius]
MASRTVLVPSAVLILRLLYLGLLAASLALIAADRLNVDSDPPQKYTFRDVYAYRFFELAYASAGLMLSAAACMALVIMLSVYSLAK